MSRLIFTLIARVRPGGVADFQAYESEVIPVLATHGGRLERRLRTPTGLIEVHVVSFPSQAAFDGYREDARCTAARGLLERSAAEMELLPVEDVADDLPEDTESGQ
jgi:hypothetical protein